MLFIMKGNYSAESIRHISGERTAQANQIVQECGGTIVDAYATLGERDILAIMEFPGVSEAMKASIRLNQAMGISFSTAPALPMEDFDKLVGQPR